MVRFQLSRPGFWAAWGLAAWCAATLAQSNHFSTIRLPGVDQSGNLSQSLGGARIGADLCR